jgi:hypothetical protein
MYRHDRGELGLIPFLGHREFSNHVGSTLELQTGEGNKRDPTLTMYCMHVLPYSTWYHLSLDRWH